MRGSVIREDNGTYTVVYDAGEQPRHVCTAKGCRWGAWESDHGPAPRECPRCEEPVATVSRRRQIKKRGFKKKTGPDGADAWLAAQIREVERGTHIDPSKITVREFVQAVWLPTLRVSTSTYRQYESVMRNRILPQIGEVQLQRLDVPRVQKMMAYLEEHGNRGKGLAPKSMWHTHFTLNKALNDAIDWDYLVRNVMAKVDTPTLPDGEMKVWTANQMRRFLEWVLEQDDADAEVIRAMGQLVPLAVSARRLYAMWLLAMTTGMRREELLGLRWCDVLWDTSELHIRWVSTEGPKGDTRHTYKPPKKNPRQRDNSSRRRIKIDARTLAALREWRKRQLAERLSAGADWIEDVSEYFVYPDGRPDNIDLVFRNVWGAPLGPGWLTKAFPTMTERADLPRLTVHGLRHSYATMMLLSGEPSKVVSQRLGHAKVGITLDLYSWVLPAVDEAAAARGSEMLWDSVDERWRRQCADCRELGEAVYPSPSEALRADAPCAACGCHLAVIVEDEEGPEEGLGEGDQA